MPEQDDRDPTVDAHGFVYRAPRHVKVHDCSWPVNWLTLRFGDGSVWRCSDCGVAWGYRRDLGYAFGMWSIHHDPRRES